MKNIKTIIATVLITLSISCSNSQDFKSVDTPEFKVLLEKTKNAQLIDVRTPEEFAAGSIENAKNINWNADDFDKQVANLDLTKPIFVYCQGGGRSKKAGSRLKELGFINIIELDGGYKSWK